MKTLLRSSLVALMLFGGYSAFSEKPNTVDNTVNTAFGTGPMNPFPQPDCICPTSPQRPPAN
jgi:hypothetical protein